MRTVVFRVDGATGDRLYADLHQALDGSGVWRLRQSLSLTASAEIIGLAVKACDALISMRDGLVADPDLRGDAYFQVRADLWRENAHLREAMRRDLGMSGLPDPEVGHYRYPATS
ncbi:hypothetical protein [Streptomyces sp. NBC_00019]|uniref:hypothetical protein n=1 Tax=Streptomyces sp. NBC_00019 TaxID=2975623 RepID=UPI00324A292B